MRRQFDFRVRVGPLVGSKPAQTLGRGRGFLFHLGPARAPQSAQPPRQFTPLVAVEIAQRGVGLHHRRFHAVSRDVRAAHIAHELAAHQHFKRGAGLAARRVDVADVRHALRDLGAGGNAAAHGREQASLEEAHKRILHIT